MAFEYLTLNKVLAHLDMTEEEMKADTESFDKKLDQNYLALCLGCNHYVDKDEYHPDKEVCEGCEPNKEVQHVVLKELNLEHLDSFTKMFNLLSKIDNF